MKTSVRIIAGVIVISIILALCGCSMDGKVTGCYVCDDGEGFLKTLKIYSDGKMYYGKIYAIGTKPPDYETINWFTSYDTDFMPEQKWDSSKKAYVPIHPSTKQDTWIQVSTEPDALDGMTWGEIRELASKLKAERGL